MDEPVFCKSYKGCGKNFMKQTFAFTDIDGIPHDVEFELIQTPGEFRTWGIRGSLLTHGVPEETAEVTERYITRGEAEATLSMLCQCQVMPCTLKDVL